MKLEIEISAKAHGKSLKADYFAWTLTEEISANDLMNTDNIKWSINVKAQKEMFILEQVKQFKKQKMRNS